MWLCSRPSALLFLFVLLIAPLALAQPDTTATLDDALSNDVDADTQADRGDTIAYTVIVENNGTTDAQSVEVSIPLDENLTLVPGSVMVGPIALDDGSGVNLGESVVVDVLANDRDIDGALDPATVTVVTAAVEGTTAVNPATGEITYTSSGAAGDDTFTYTVNDDDGLLSREALVTISVNTCPAAQDDAFQTGENDAVTGNVLADNGNGADEDGDADSLTVSAVEGSAANVGVPVLLASGATLTISGDGALDYDPGTAFDSLDDGQSDTDTFSYAVTDGRCELTATVTVTIDGVNDCPVAEDDAFDVIADVPAITGNVFADNGNGADNESDAGDALTVTEVNGNSADVGVQITLPSGALLTLNADGSFTYDPNGQFDALVPPATGADSFTYTLDDGDCTDTGTVSLTILAVNDCPSAQFDLFTTDQNTPANGNLLDDNGNGPDTDADGDAITVISVEGNAANVDTEITLSSGALLTVNADGTFSYDPNGAFDALDDTESTTDSFEYVIDDGNCDTPPTATVTITINGINDCPVAIDDDYTTNEDISIIDSVFVDSGNGADFDADTSDTLTVSEVNGNAGDVGVEISLPSGALLTLNSTGSWNYNVNGAFNDLAGGESTTDAFDYTITDGDCTAGGTVTITINGANDCPTATFDLFTTDEDTPINGNLITDDNSNGPDADPDTSDTLVIAEIEGSAANVGVPVVITSGATVTANADGTFSYDPTGTTFDELSVGNSTTDSFEYTLTDGDCPQAATVTITINGVNDCPVAQDDALASTEDAPLAGNVFDDNGSGIDSDVDVGDSFLVTEVDGNPGAVGVATSTTGGGLVTLNSDGTFSYDPNGAFTALAQGATTSDSFDYTIFDGDCTDTATVTITITGENDCPVAQSDDVTTDEDTVLNGDLFADNSNGVDSDPDSGDSFAVTEVNGSAGNLATPIALGSGTLTVNADGTFSFDPDGGYEVLASGDTDTETFTYTISDGDCTDTETVFLEITGVNDCPAAEDDALTTDENTPLNGDVLADNGNGADSDVDTGDTITVTELEGASGAIGVATAIPSGALVTLNSDGTFTYDTNGAFDALGLGDDDTDSFAYTISDGDCTDTATVTIAITGANDCPVINDDDAATDEDTPLNGDMFADNGSGADTDPEGDSLTVLTVNGGAPGTVTLASGATVNFSSDGTFTYDPNDQFESLPLGNQDTDSFTYTVDDGSGTCSETGTFTITINGANDCPVAQDDAGINTDEDTATGGDIFANNGNGVDADVDGDSFNVTAVNGNAGAVGGNFVLPSGAQVNVSSGGTFTYDPLSAFQSLSTGDNTTDSFTYTISDGTCTDTATVTIGIAGVSDAPIAQNQTGNATFGNVEFVANSGGLSAAPNGSPVVTGTLNLKDGVVDPDTAPAGISAIPATGASVAGGAYQIFADGSFTYMPPTGVTGTDAFSYQLTDGVANSNTASVSISIAHFLWFINNTGGGSGGAGTSTNPFKTIADFNTLNSAGGGLGGSARIYIFGTGTDYTTGILLRNGQTVEGGGVPFVVDTVTLLPAGTRPNITSTTNNGVTLAQNNTLRGFNIGNCPGFFKISGTAAGDLAISNMTLSGTGGLINITTSAAFGSNVTFDSVSSSSSPGSAINLVGCTGTLGLGVAGSGIGGSASGSDAVRVSGGSVSFTYSGSLTKTNTGRLISIADTTGGAINFDRATTSGLGGNTGCTGILIDGCAGNVTIGGALTGNPTPYVNLIGPNGIEILGDATNNQTGAVTINNAAITTTSGHGFTVNGDVSGAAGNDVAATIALNNVDITNPTGRVASISGLGGGSVTFDASSDIVRNNGGSGIICDSNAGGTITFASTTKTLTTNANPGVSLTSNTGTTIDFTGGNLDIDTTIGIGYNATGGGTVTVQGSNNTINSGTGTALNVSSTTIGASDLTFQSISHSGGANGIVLNTTGTSGGLTVTGTGTTVGSGGTIQNTTGAGISLTSTADVSLNGMIVANTGSHGISGTGVINAGNSGTVNNSFTFSNGLLNSPGDSDNEQAIEFGTIGTTNITGRLTLSGSTIQDYEDTGLYVVNISGDLVIDVTDMIFNNNSDTTGEEGISVDASGTANTTLNVMGTPSGLPSSGAFTSTTTFTNIEGGAINAFSQGSGVLDFNLTSVHITTGTPGGPDNFPTPPALTFVAEGSASSFTFDIINSRIDDSSGDGIFIGQEGTIEGRITGNTITGIALGDGIRIDTDTTSSATSTVLVQNNTITNCGDDGIQVLHRDGTKTLNLTINSNVITNTASEGIRYFADDDVAGGGPLNRLQITSNTFGSNGTADTSDSIVIISQDPGTDINTEITGNTSVEGITLQQSGSATLTIEQASTAALGAANGGATVTPFGTITVNTPVTVPQPGNP